jgi:heme-degrading monooxygenase HmoA
MPEQWGYVVIWEFRVPAHSRQRFESAYGPAGEWAQFFSQAREFFGTELLGDATEPGRYLTLDYWRSQAAYEKFLAANETRYSAIDERCEDLTESERQIGRFTRAGSAQMPLNGPRV